jgi:hypothetical protein
MYQMLVVMLASGETRMVLSRVGGPETCHRPWRKNFISRINCWLLLQLIMQSQIVASQTTSGCSARMFYQTVLVELLLKVQEKKCSGWQ